MAKRVRYAGRPSPKKPSKRPSSAAAPAAAKSIAYIDPVVEPLAMDEVVDELARPSSAHLTDVELKRAEQLEAAIAAQEKEALAEAVRRKARSHAGDSHLDDVNAPLSVRAAHEYAYVARDVRRILVTGGIMAAILAGLAILINGFGVLSL